MYNNDTSKQIDAVTYIYTYTYIHIVNESIDHFD